MGAPRMLKLTPEAAHEESRGTEGVRGWQHGAFNAAAKETLAWPRRGRGAAVRCSLCACHGSARVRERAGEGDDVVTARSASSGWYAAASAKRCARPLHSASVRLVGSTESIDSGRSLTRTQRTVLTSLSFGFEAELGDLIGVPN